jgi:hypothetical protein
MEDEAILRSYDEAMPFPNLRIYRCGRFTRRFRFQLTLIDMHKAPQPYKGGMQLMTAAHKLVIEEALHNDSGYCQFHSDKALLHYPFPLATVKIEDAGLQPHFIDNYYYEFVLLRMGLVVRTKCSNSTSEEECFHFLVLEGENEGHNFRETDRDCSFDNWPAKEPPPRTLLSSNILVGTRNPSKFGDFGYVDDTRCCVNKLSS